jgi:hypothetical protein
VTGLTADTEYEITIDGKDTERTVVTAPAEVTEPLTFAEGGDIGIWDPVPALHQNAAAWEPLFAIVGGDLAYANGNKPIKWLSFVERWSEHMVADDRLIPMVPMIGNHEVKGQFGGTPADAPLYYKLCDPANGDAGYWTLDIGADISIVMLDSNHTAPIDGEQKRWLDDQLTERQDRQHLMTASHVPAYPSRGDMDTRGSDTIREHWVPLYEKHDVDVVFEHDAHAYKRTHQLRDGEPDADGVLYVGDGAWGKKAASVDSPNERSFLAQSAAKAHNIRVALDPDGTQRFRAVDPEGNVIDAFDGASNG